MIWALLASAAVANPLSAYEEAVANRNLNEAADALVAVLDDEAASEHHATAWARLGDVLADERLPYFALVAWTQAIDADSKAGSSVVSKALETADSLGDERILEPILAAHLDLETDTGSLSQVALLAARNFVREDELSEALGVLMMVDKGSPAFVEAELLRAIILSHQGKHADALAPLVTAHAITKNNEDASNNGLLDVLELNIARAYFGAENWGQAITWYAQVDRDSRHWPEAHYERAWTHFRANDMQGALALLVTHESPFYEGWNWAEADLLRTNSFFLLCKLPEATKLIDAFDTTYRPMKEELDAALASADAKAAFADGTAAMRGEPTATLPMSVIRPFTWESGFADAVKATEAAEEELANVTGRTERPWTAKMAPLLTARRDAIASEQGERILERANVVSTEWNEMLSGIEITRLDLLDFETRLYERAAATGELEQGDRIGKLRKMRKKRGAWVWPFQGEYWEDELGWYTVDARAECPASLAEKPPTQ